MKTKLEFALGIARKAGAVLTGTEIIRDAIRAKKLRCVILASDASDNTKKRLRNSCDFHKVKLFEVSLTMDALSSAVGLQRLTSAVGIGGHSVLRLVYDALQVETNEES